MARLKLVHISAVVLLCLFLNYSYFNNFQSKESIPEVRSEKPDGNGPNIGNDDVFTSTQLDRCEWIKNLLLTNRTIGGPLPQPKIARKGGGVFWLKTPVLHTIDPDTGKEIILLKYNIYNAVQHIQKFNNTVNILTKYSTSPLFPKLYGFCRDIEGYHFIAVEYIDMEPQFLDKPKSLDECVNRAYKVLSTFDQMDQLGLTLIDFKVGQWMVRKDGNFVLQDVDDIVRAPAPGLYHGQMNGDKYRLKKRNHLDTYNITKIWDTKIFPNNLITIRLDVFGTETILNNIGFRWKEHCSGYTKEFQSCLNRIIDWTLTVQSDWPDFKQISSALRSCYVNNTFVRTKRKSKPWHVVKEIEDKEYTRLDACTRSYDKASGDKMFFKCGESCCRANGMDPCYYTTDTSMCNMNI